jgi:hypothetical protein
MTTGFIYGIPMFPKSESHIACEVACEVAIHLTFINGKQ